LTVFAVLLCEADVGYSDIKMGETDIVQLLQSCCCSCHEIKKTLLNFVFVQRREMCGKLIQFYSCKTNTSDITWKCDMFQVV